MRIVLHNGHFCSDAYAALLSHFLIHSGWKKCLHIGILNTWSPMLKLSIQMAHSWMLYLSSSAVVYEYSIFSSCSITWTILCLSFATLFKFLFSLKPNLIWLISTRYSPLARTSSLALARSRSALSIWPSSWDWKNLRLSRHRLILSQIDRAILHTQLTHMTIISTENRVFWYPPTKPWY